MHLTLEFEYTLLYGILEQSFFLVLVMTKISDHDSSPHREDHSPSHPECSTPFPSGNSGFETMESSGDGGGPLKRISVLRVLDIIILSFLMQDACTHCQRLEVILG